MIKLTYKDGTVRRFNLKNQEREKSLYNAWYSMSDDIKYDGKSFKINTDTGEVIYVKIGDLEKCAFDDSRYISGEFNTGNVSDRYKKEDKKDTKEDKVDEMMAKIEKAKKENLKKFLSVLKERGVEPDGSDIFNKICESVSSCTDDYKIKMYANMYCNIKQGKV